MSSLLFLPPEFYGYRELHSRALAAILIVEPSLTPSREELPRDGLHEELQRVLAANAARVGESISLDYMRLVGSSVLAELLRQFTGPQIFVFNFWWHLAAVKECARIEAEHERLIKKILVLSMDSENSLRNFA